MQILAAGLGEAEGMGSRESKGRRLALLPRAPAALGGTAFNAGAARGRFSGAVFLPLT